VQVGGFELDGPYFSGRLKGDHVTVCVRPDQLRAIARNGRPGPNQIPAGLTRTVERSQSMRLEFEGGIAVDLSRLEYDRQRDNQQWVIEFPTDKLRVV
jgi:hypothetical protein